MLRRSHVFWLTVITCAAVVALPFAQRISRAESDPARLVRIKAASPMPKVSEPISFDTPEADAIVAALEIFPPDNPWNQLVTDWPVHPNSAKLVAAVGDNKVLRAND